MVYPGALEEDTTVWFAFDAENELWEGVLPIREEESRARLVGVPLWTYGVNLDDVVELIASGEGAPVAARFIDRSGNRTLRVTYPDLEAGDDEQPFRIWRNRRPRPLRLHSRASQLSCAAARRAVRPISPSRPRGNPPLRLWAAGAGISWAWVPLFR